MMKLYPCKMRITRKKFFVIFYCRNCYKFTIFCDKLWTISNLSNISDHRNFWNI